MPFEFGLSQIAKEAKIEWFDLRNSRVFLRLQIGTILGLMRREKGGISLTVVIIYSVHKMNSEC